MKKRNRRGSIAVETIAVTAVTLLVAAGITIGVSKSLSSTGSRANAGVQTQAKKADDELYAYKGVDGDDGLAREKLKYDKHFVHTDGNGIQWWENGEFMYANIRPAYMDSKGVQQTDVWVKIVVLEDGLTCKVVESAAEENASAWNGETAMTGEISFPDMVNKLTIVSIDKGAFLNCDFSGSLVLPKGLTEVGESSFESSQFTGKINFPDSLIRIGDKAFENSVFTDSLSLPNGLAVIGERAFLSSSFEGNLTLPDKLVSVGASALANSKFINGLVLPEGIVSIEDYAFMSSKFDGELLLPESLTTIGKGALRASIFTGKLTLPESLNLIGSESLFESQFDEILGNITVEVPSNAIKMSDGTYYSRP